jgi:hypothetical protein
MVSPPSDRDDHIASFIESAKDAFERAQNSTDTGLEDSYTRVAEAYMRLAEQEQELADRLAHFPSAILSRRVSSSD